MNPGSQIVRRAGLVMLEPAGNVENEDESDRADWPESDPDARTR
jgi:hypothetical protein